MSATHIELPVKLPQEVTVEWVQETQERLLVASRGGIATVKQVLPLALVTKLFGRTERLLQAEAPLLELLPGTTDSVFTVVGDTHGQFHDVCNMLELMGRPSEQCTYVFNGDFVDRGAWGLETLTLLCCWKLALPQNVFMLRGNHESATCTLMYGYKGELVAKYGRGAWKSVYTASKKLFSALPLGALINRQTLVLHGGLFRQQPRRATGKHKRTCLDEVVLGTLEDLRRASKGGMDPAGLGAGRLATDVLWSDPTTAPGFAENITRGIGMVFGPDITEQFLRHNELKLILRSHEGPDARDDREDMGNMLEGYTLDHITESGTLMTVFSAPDYPQFMADDSRRYRNKAAVAVLSAPDYSTPAMKQFEAVLPRPEAVPFYDLFVGDSDEEYEPATSDASGMTDVREERTAARSDGGCEGEEASGGKKRAKRDDSGDQSPPLVEPTAALGAEGGKKENTGSEAGSSLRRSPRASPTKWNPLS